MRSYVLLIAFSFTVSYLLTPLVRSVGARFLAGQQVRERDMHSSPVVKFGGVAMIAAILGGIALASQLDFFSGVFTNPEYIIGIAAALAVVVILGLTDDLWDLKWYLKFGGQLLIGAIIAQSGIVIKALPVGTWSIEAEPMQNLVTMGLVVLTMNAINFSDGLDGLAAGLTAIGAVTFFLYSYVLATHVSAEDYANLAALLCAVLLGSCLGFLPHNFNPANIFMGETGVLALGLILSVSTVLVTGDVQGLEAHRFRNVPAYMPMALPLVIIFFPALDLLLSVIRRLSKRSSPFKPDSLHIHHRMLAVGHSVRKSVLLLYLWALLVAAGVVLIAFIPLHLMIPLYLLLLVGAGMLTWWPIVSRRYASLTERLRKQ